MTKLSSTGGIILINRGFCEGSFSESFREGWQKIFEMSDIKEQVRDISNK